MIDERLPAALLIQTYYRTVVQRRQRLASLTRLSKIDDSKPEVDNRLRKRSVDDDTATIDIRRIPVGSLAVTVSFLGSMKDILAVMLACKHLHKLFTFNRVWNSFFELNYPALVAHIRESNDNRATDRINIRQLAQTGVEETNRLTDEYT